MRELVSNLVAKVGRGAPKPEPVSDDGTTSPAQGPFRLWMTSSLAVVMLSMFAARPPLQGERPAPFGHALRSPAKRSVSSCRPPLTLLKTR